MTRKQKILSCLYKSYLNSIAADHGITGANQINFEDLVSTLSSMRSVKIKYILEDMPLQDLKIICQNVGIDDKGNKKALLVDRLLGRDTKVQTKPKHVKKLVSKLKPPAKPEP